MAGKGSAPRPYSVSAEEFGDRFDAIFRKTERAATDGTNSDEPALINAGEMNGIPEGTVG